MNLRTVAAGVVDFCEAILTNILSMFHDAVPVLEPEFGHRIVI